MPPRPPIPADAISALLARKVVVPSRSIDQARRHSFSPQQKSRGPWSGLDQNAGDPCRWCVFPS
jgi:hypothetical protein